MLLKHRESKEFEPLLDRTVIDSEVVSVSGDLATRLINSKRWKPSIETKEPPKSTSRKRPKGKRRNN